MQSTAYLIVSLSPVKSVFPTLVVDSAGIYSSPPEGLTANLNQGFYACVLSMVGEDYSEAQNKIREWLFSDSCPMIFRHLRSFVSEEDNLRDARYHIRQAIK